MLASLGLSAFRATLGREPGQVDLDEADAVQLDEGAGAFGMRVSLLSTAAHNQHRVMCGPKTATARTSEIFSSA